MPIVAPPTNSAGIEQPEQPAKISKRAQKIIDDMHASNPKDLEPETQFSQKIEGDNN
jgi:hypothetical protein